MESGLVTPRVAVSANPAGWPGRRPAGPRRSRTGCRRAGRSRRRCAPARRRGRPSRRRRARGTRRRHRWPSRRRCPRHRRRRSPGRPGAGRRPGSRGVGVVPAERGPGLAQPDVDGVQRGREVAQRGGAGPEGHRHRRAVVGAGVGPDRGDDHVGVLAEEGDRPAHGQRVVRVVEVERGVVGGDPGKPVGATGSTAVVPPSGGRRRARPGRPRTSSSRSRCHPGPVVPITWTDQGSAASVLQTTPASRKPTAPNRQTDSNQRRRDTVLQPSCPRPSPRSSEAITRGVSAHSQL